MAKPIKCVITGMVSYDIYGKGSKSERKAHFIDEDGIRLVLRRKTGPVFGDVELNQYIGKEVECSGFLTENTFLAETIKVI